MPRAIKIGESNKLGKHGAGFIVFLAAISEPFFSLPQSGGKKAKESSVDMK